MSTDCSLKSLTSTGSNEVLQSHNSLTFKLLKTVADFSQALATLHDNFGHELQMLVETFRKRNGELRKERFHCPNSLFQVWELFLQQVEVNSQQHGDISRNFGQTIGNGLIERVFHRKIQSKKVFAHRDRIETILLKSSELLLKCYRDYCQAYALALTNPAQYMSEYIASHNVYVHQLQATNGMIHAYQTKTLPRLLEELEECHLDTSLSISSSLLESSELVCEKCNEQALGYQSIALACKQTNHRQDLGQFVKLAAASSAASSANELLQQSGASPKTGSLASEPALAGEQQERSISIRYHQFQAPSLQNCPPDYDSSSVAATSKNMQIVPLFKNEIAPDLSLLPEQQQPQLELERASLDEKIERLEERLESMGKLLARSTESRLHNKVNEIQEELCQKRFELHVAQIHLSAVRAQLQLFEYNYRPFQVPEGLMMGSQADQASLVGSTGGGAGGPLSRKTSSNLMAQPLGYRNKWIKAFKSLKETPTQVAVPAGQSKFADESNLQKQQELLMSQGQDIGQQPQQAQQLAQQQPENQHFFQEYTFKKIASCDVCKDFLRGHMRQGVKCKLCKISCHNDCQSKAHAMLKCQQPKVKLLRRQKSAGELEVNNSDVDSGDPGERTLSSKPDSIYQLIKQVLDAKKKGGSQAAQQQVVDSNPDYHHLRVNHPYGALNNSAMLNLSTGNLALANQDGKSVSTSALGTSAMAASVDRWAVVMDLLAESRKKDKENLAAPEGDAGASGKRHSKQLDKFKLAAKSVSKHHYLKQQQQQQQQQSRQQVSPTNLHSDVNNQQPDSQSPGRYGGQQQPQLGLASSAPASHQYGAVSQQQHHLAQSNEGAYLGGQLSHNPSGVAMGMAGAEQLHLHHTKSLPVGKLLQPRGPVAAVRTGQHAAGLMPAAAMHAGGQPEASGPMQAGPSALQHPGQMPYQMFGLGSQSQLQSTSAPHSPQRKRFNMRMKSFSLDSPESPSVLQAPASGYPQLAHSSGLNLDSLDNRDLQQQQQHGGYELHQQSVPVYLGQQHQVYVSQAQSGYAQAAYLPQYHQQAPAAQYVEADHQLSAYLSANRQYQHRHSYHNPTLHYGSAQGDLRRNAEGQHSSSQSALNSLHLAAEAPEKGSSASNEAMSPRVSADVNDYYDLDVSLRSNASSQQQQQQKQQQQQPPPSQAQQQSQPSPPPTGTYVALYDYVAQRSDEMQMNAGQLVAVLDTSERDWWKVQSLDGSNRTGYFPASYLALLYQNERPLQVVQTIQVSNGESCNKLLRGQIVIHTGKQMDSFVTIRTVTAADSSNHYIQCPEKYLMEVVESG